MNIKNSIVKGVQSNGTYESKNHGLFISMKLLLKMVILENILQSLTIKTNLFKGKKLIT